MHNQRRQDWLAIPVELELDFLQPSQIELETEWFSPRVCPSTRSIAGSFEHAEEMRHHNGEPFIRHCIRLLRKCVKIAGPNVIPFDYDPALDLQRFVFNYLPSWHCVLRGWGTLPRWRLGDAGIETIFRLHQLSYCGLEELELGTLIFWERKRLRFGLTNGRHLFWLFSFRVRGIPDRFVLLDAMGSHLDSRCIESRAIKLPGALEFPIGRMDTDHKRKLRPAIPTGAKSSASQRKSCPERSDRRGPQADRQ